MVSILKQNILNAGEKLQSSICNHAFGNPWRKGQDFTPQDTRLRHDHFFPSVIVPPCLVASGRQRVRFPEQFDDDLPGRPWQIQAETAFPGKDTPGIS